MNLQIGGSGEPWRVIGQGEAATFAVAPGGQVQVRAGGRTVVLPVAIAVALQTEEAKAFLADPKVGAFLYGGQERESRKEAAIAVAKAITLQERKAWVKGVVEAGLLPEAEAWSLARVKFPEVRPLDTREPRLEFDPQTGVARRV